MAYCEKVEKVSFLEEGMVSFVFGLIYSIRYTPDKTATDLNEQDTVTSPLITYDNSVRHRILQLVRNLCETYLGKQSFDTALMLEDDVNITLRKSFIIKIHKIRLYRHNPPYRYCPDNSNRGRE